ncbi:hypothetical protein JB92DRAFT_3120373 [Gautieria morchelliformis]|nr:hypothetical protein JB92DRAFT_3120373 [Gautieria morchelliformis]
MAEITNVDDRCEEEATQLQSHSQSTPPQGQDHLDATSASSLMSSSTPVPSASPSPSSAASAVAAACSTNTPNPLQTRDAHRPYYGHGHIMYGGLTDTADPHKITRTPTVGTLSVRPPSTYSTSNPGAGLNMPTSLHISLASQPTNNNTDGGYTSYNNKSNTAYTNAASSAYIPSAMNAALGSGGVTVRLCPYASISSFRELTGTPVLDHLSNSTHLLIPPALDAHHNPASSTTPAVRALLPPHLPRALRFLAETRRLSDSGLGLEEDGVGPGMNGERERLAAIGHEQPGPLTEHGFGFEGGGMGAHNADDGNRFDAYGDMNGNGGTYGNADTNVDAFAAEDVYSYTDADANSVICTNNANAQAERSHEGERKSEKHQQPIISGLPGAATEGGGPTIRFMRVLKEDRTEQHRQLGLWTASESRPLYFTLLLLPILILLHLSTYIHTLSALHTPATESGLMSNDTSASGAKGRSTPTQRPVTTPSMAQAKLDAQGRIQPRAATGPAREKQTEPLKRSENPAEKRAPATRAATRGAVSDQETLTGEEIRGLPGQEISDIDAGKLYLERTLLTVPGAPWTVGALSTAILQVTQYKGIPRQAINALRSIAFVLEEVEDDARCERIVSQVREGLAAEGNALSAKILEATALIDKATAAAETAARLSHQVTEDAAAAVQTVEIMDYVSMHNVPHRLSHPINSSYVTVSTCVCNRVGKLLPYTRDPLLAITIQSASNTVASSATQLNETSTTYRDAVLKAATATQHMPPGAATLDARVRAREGIKQRQVLVDAANAGEHVLADLDDIGLALKANEAISDLDAEGQRIVVSARRLTNGGVLFELNTEEAARWLNEAGRRTQFTEALSPDARMKARSYLLVIQFVPLHFEPEREGDLRGIEVVNRLPQGAIDKARWIKPKQR